MNDNEIEIASSGAPKAFIIITDFWSALLKILPGQLEKRARDFLVWLCYNLACNDDDECLSRWLVYKELSPVLFSSHLSSSVISKMQSLTVLRTFAPILFFSGLMDSPTGSSGMQDREL